MKRRLCVIAGLLALGALVNVAVAWTCALTTGFGGGTALELYAALGEDHHWTVHRWNRAAASRIVSRSWHGLAAGPYNVGEPAHLLASWGHIEPPGPETPGTVSQLDEAWGFPMRALSCRTEERELPGAPPRFARSGVMLLAAAEAAGQRAAYLPLRPIWWGFAVNTVLYALVCLVACAAARDLRRLAARRLRPAPGGDLQTPYTS